MFITADGEFEPVPSIEFDAKGRPALKGRLRVAIGTHARNLLEERARERLMVLGRSGHAQVGLELERNVDEQIVLERDVVSVPITMRALGAVRELWLDTILDLYSKGRLVKAGRLLALEDSPRMSKAEIERLFAEELIAVEGDFGINDDGSIRVFLDQSTFTYDVLEFAEADVREQVLVHSRMALQKYQDHATAERFPLKAQSLVVTGIRFSSGPFPALIKSELGGGVRHVRSGVFLDGFRSTRIDRRYGVSGLRQIELFNDSDTDRTLGADNYVDIEILPAPDARHPQGIFAKKSNRKFYHRHGVPLSGVIDLDKPRVQKALFDKICRSPHVSSFHARVITPNGLTNIPWATSAKFQHAKTEKGIESVLGTRDLATETMPVSLALKNSVDHGRVFVSHTLPAPDDLFWLRELGIRAFIFKDMTRHPVGAAENAPNVFMTGHLHETIHQLSLEGVSFSQVLNTTGAEAAKAEVRDYFKGFWCLPDSKIRSESVTTLVNMYGWHKSHLLCHSEIEIERMLRSIGSRVGMQTVGVMHGKGPGFMLLADELARKLGMLSIGVGLDVEKVGQYPNFLPDLALDFVSHERAYRQKLMDQLGLIKVFNLGGYGTLEELAITLCSYKLFESVPAPIILVDESAAKEVTDAGEVSKNFWHPLRDQVEMICKTTKLRYPGGQVADVTASPFGLTWMVNLIHCVPTYRMAGEIIDRFMRNPREYWREAGLTEVESTMAVKSYEARLDYYGFKLPAFLNGLS